jgi:hypothetical protein
MLTLTVNRANFRSPGFAYDRVEPRVREVARSLRRICPEARFAVFALELQGKTGDGWPHWHGLIYFGESMLTLDEIKDAVDAAWCVASESIDEATGEVDTGRYHVGFADVAEARENRGCAKYMAKYLMKPWPAIPGWMGESNRQLRKLRFSRSCFEWFESVGRHIPRRGSRRKAVRSRRPALPLFDRMSRSGSGLQVFQRLRGRFVHLAYVPLPMDGRGVAILDGSGATWLRGSPGESHRRWAFAIPTELFERLNSPRNKPRLRKMRRKYIAQQRRTLEGAWARMQGIRNHA